MARPPRLEVLNGVYHVFARGNNRAAIFTSDADRRRFLEVLADVRTEYRWIVLAYCLMDNHYHLLLQTPEPTLSRGMRQLNGVYAQWFNRRHDRVGHVLQGRYGARLVQADEHLRVAVRYIVRNPVRARLSSSPGGWRFSSHRSALGYEPARVVDVDALLAFYGQTPDVARSRYREHAESADGDGVLLMHPLVVGDDTFVREMLGRLERKPGVPRRYLRELVPELSELLASRRDEDLARAHEHGHSLRAIAGHLGCNASTVSRRLRRYRAGRSGATKGT